MSESLRSHLGMASIIGQTEPRRRIAERVKIAKANNWPFPHMLICSDSGMGRFTLALAVAKEISGTSKIVEVSSVKQSLDLNGGMSTTENGGCLVLRNLDNMEYSAISKGLGEYFESRCINVLIGTGAGARVHTLPLPEFCIIATCSNRFAIPPCVLASFTVEVLDPYSRQELTAIASSQAATLGFRLDEAAAACAADSAGTGPGSIYSLLKRVKRYAGNSTLNEADFLSVLDVLGVSRKTTSTGSGLITDINRMSGVEFEHWTAALFEKHGYRVKPTRTVGDHGIDLEMERAGRRVVVQCKRWADTVGEPTVREFYGSVLNARAEAGIFVTTSSFTIQARRFVQQKPITLLDFKGLLDLFLYGGSVEDVG